MKPYLSAANLVLLPRPIGLSFALLLILALPLHAQVAGSLDQAFDPDVPSASGGNVNSVVVQTDGKTLIGGEFSYISGQPRGRIARLLADGSLESTLTFHPGSGANGEVFAVAVQSDRKILIGGDFTMVNGQPRGGIARLEADGDLDASFNPGTGATGGFGGVRCVAVQTDGFILIGGGFDGVNGVAHRGIARLDDDGDVDLLFDPGTGASGRVNSVAVQADGKILIGGSFNNVNGIPRGNIARLETNGTVEITATFDTGSGASGPVRSIVVQSDRQILIGGSFLSVNGEARGMIARLNTNGSLESLTTFNPGAGASGPFGSGSVNSIAVQPDGKIVIAGEFDNVNFVACNNIARLNSDGSLEIPPAFDPGTGTAGPFGNGDILSVALADGKILIGGRFTSVDGHLPGKIARLKSDGTFETSAAFNPGIVSSSFSAGILNATAVQPDGKIVIVGQFSSVDGTACGNIARLLSDGSIDLPAAIQFGTGTDSDGPINCVVVQPDGKMVIGGQFTSVNRQPRNYLARLLRTGEVESDATFHPAIEAPGQVHCLAVQPDGMILVGGTFTMVQGQSRNGIARLDADGALDASFDPGPGAEGQFVGRVYSMAVQADGKILLGGDFTMVRGVARNGIARLEAGGALDASFDPGAGADGDVNCITVQADGRILIGGTFRNVNNLPCGSIARLDDQGAVEGTATFNPGTGITDGYVSSIAVQANGKILLGGVFNSVNSFPRTNIARLNANGTVESTATFDTGMGTDIPVNSVALQADGEILLGGQFTLVAGQTRNGIARLNNDSISQSLTASGGVQVQWARGGAAPEIEQVAFELSTDGGVNWTPLGPGSRIAGGWERTGLSLPGSGRLRARGRTVSGQNNGSSGLVEQIVAFDSLTETPTLTTPANGALTKSPVAVSFTLPETALAGSVTLSFGPHTLVLAVNQQSAGAHAFSFDPANPTASPQIASGSPIPDGTYTVTLAYQDAAGNPPANATRLNVTLDTTTPDTTIASGPSGTMPSGTASFEFTASEPALQFTYTLDGGAPLETTEATVTFTGLSEAVHTFSVQATDLAGNRDPTPATRTWTVDLPAPVAGNGDSTFENGTNGPVLNFPVSTIAVQPDGKFLVAGLFTFINDLPRSRIARFNPTGTPDYDFDAALGPSGSGGLIQALAVLTNGQILVAGSFTQMNGLTRNRIARLNSDGSVDTVGFQIGTGANSYIQIIAVQPDGKILIAGDFTTFNAQPRLHIARLESNGAVDPSFDPANVVNGYVGSIALQPDGKILIGGGYFNSNGQAAPPVLRLYSNGSQDTNFNCTLASVGTVNCVAVQTNGHILVAGFFPGAAGPSETGIKRLLPDGTEESATTFHPGTNYNGIRDLVVQADGKILLAGGFSTLNGEPRGGIARLWPDGTLETTDTFDTGLGALLAGSSATVEAIALQADGKILLGGNFTTVAGLPFPRLARLINDPASSSLTVPTATRVQWSRGGSAPEVGQVTFEHSNDSGVSWTLLGSGSRIFGGWELISPSLPTAGLFRARGRTADRTGNPGIVEQTFSRSTLSALEQWRGLIFGVNTNNLAIAGNAADPDSDGVPNVLEYAGASDPLNPDSVPRRSWAFAGGSFLYFYDRRVGTTEIAYGMERSDDLLTWFNASFTEEILSNNGVILEMKATVDISLNNPAQPKGFLRAKVTVTP